MLYSIDSVQVELYESLEEVAQKLATQINLTVHDIHSLTCVRRAIDARKKNHIHFVCSYEFETEKPIELPPANCRPTKRSRLSPNRPATLAGKVFSQADVIIVGAGPAGLFAALAMAESGIKVTLLERGKPVETRMRDIGRLRSRSELNPESNICFGEGGAGTYTDGKLYTRIKHPYLRWVLAQFVRFGASKEILVDAHPHLGTDKLVRIIRNMREHLLALGVNYQFECRVDHLMIKNGKVYGVHTASGEELTADHVVLATGHSARDTFEILQKLGVYMEAKSFAVGVRAEHPQRLINNIQFGKGADHKKTRCCRVFTHPSGC